MGIATKTGDKGWTALRFNRRVRKDNPRLQVVGTLDELNSFLGLARCAVRRKRVRDIIERLQRELFTVSSEFSTLPQDRKRLESTVDEKTVRRLEDELAQLEGQIQPQGGRFVIPGQNRASALLHVCRCVCRRAERAAVRLQGRRTALNPFALKYLNRLSDLLYILARAEAGS